jgi:hypothetical protein
VQDQLRLLRTISDLVVLVIPPLMRLGWIDRSGCIVLGAMIGVVVAFLSIRLAAKQIPRGSKFGSYFGHAERFSI